jgi:hypothetical protein
MRKAHPPSRIAPRKALRDKMAGQVAHGSRHKVRHFLVLRLSINRLHEYIIRNLIVDFDSTGRGIRNENGSSILISTTKTPGYFLAISVFLVKAQLNELPWKSEEVKFAFISCM